MVTRFRFPLRVLYSFTPRNFTDLVPNVVRHLGCWNTRFCLRFDFNSSMISVVTKLCCLFMLFDFYSDYFSVAVITEDVKMSSVNE